MLVRLVSNLLPFNTFRALMCLTHAWLSQMRFVKSWGQAFQVLGSGISNKVFLSMPDLEMYVPFSSASTPVPNSIFIQNRAFLKTLDGYFSRPVCLCQRDC